MGNGGLEGRTPGVQMVSRIRRARRQIGTRALEWWFILRLAGHHGNRFLDVRRRSGRGRPPNVGGENKQTQAPGGPDFAAPRRQARAAREGHLSTLSTRLLFPGNGDWVALLPEGASGARDALKDRSAARPRCDRRGTCRSSFRVLRCEHGAPTSWPTRLGRSIVDHEASVPAACRPSLVQRHARALCDWAPRGLLAHDVSLAPVGRGSPTQYVRQVPQRVAELLQPPLA